mmetsp:Transcript_4809/g.11272  ORF Transcript_4809/g.11272 Transcript_4809/m.11272 type:complete len:204 (-) Transcript_4809:180-791(-)
MRLPTWHLPCFLLAFLQPAGAFAGNTAFELVRYTSDGPFGTVPGTWLQDKYFTVPTHQSLDYTYTLEQCRTICQLNTGCEGFVFVPEKCVSASGPFPEPAWYGRSTCYHYHRSNDNTWPMLTGNLVMDRPQQCVVEGAQVKACCNCRDGSECHEYYRLSDPNTTLLHVVLALNVIHCVGLVALSVALALLCRSSNRKWGGPEK